MAERGSPARTSRAGWGICECADSQAISLLYHSAWQYGAGAQHSDGGDQCQMSAISSLCLYSLNMHKYICTPSNIDSLCSLWQAQAVCFCGLMSPLYLSVITLELSDPKTKGSPWRVPALLAEGPHLPSLISSLTPPFILHSVRLSINVYRGNQPVRLCVHCSFALADNRLFCLPPFCLAICPPPSSPLQHQRGFQRC